MPKFYNVKTRQWEEKEEELVKEEKNWIIWEGDGSAGKPFRMQFIDIKN